MTAWVAVDDPMIERLWPDAPYESGIFLESAQAQCEAFAGPVPLPEARHKLALLMQARALHRSTVAGSGDSLGGEFTVTVFPLDWTVKSLLRPTPGIPVLA